MLKVCKSNESCEYLGRAGSKDPLNSGIRRRRELYTDYACPHPVRREMFKYKQKLGNSYKTFMESWSFD